MLDDETKWQTIHNGFYASPDEKSVIGKILIPGFFTQHTIRVFCTSLSAKSSWWLAGRLIHLLGSSGTEPDFVAPQRWRIGLQEKTLIVLPSLTPEYRLKFEPPKWLKELALVIEIYTGE